MASNVLAIYKAHKKHKPQTKYMRTCEHRKKVVEKQTQTNIEHHNFSIQQYRETVREPPTKTQKKLKGPKNNEKMQLGTRKA